MHGFLGEDSQDPLNPEEEEAILENFDKVFNNGI